MTKPESTKATSRAYSHLGDAITMLFNARFITSVFDAFMLRITHVIQGCSFIWGDFTGRLIVLQLPEIILPMLFNWHVLTGSD